MSKPEKQEALDFQRAAELLEAHWQAVAHDAGAHSDLSYLDEESLRAAIYTCVNHDFVSYRFCLPVQLLGKLANPTVERRGDAAYTTAVFRQVLLELYRRQQSLRFTRALANGQNLYRFDFFDLARSVLALGDAQHVPRQGGRSPRHLEQTTSSPAGVEAAARSPVN